VVGTLRLRGTYVPVVTPFDERGAVALDAQERLVADCLAAGAAGVVTLATTGPTAR
jgi:4-hydroxy-tetrahydrodipicolinate synthase